jgi:hypothetical protein
MYEGARIFDRMKLGGQRTNVDAEKSTSSFIALLREGSSTGRP